MVKEKKSFRERRGNKDIWARILTVFNLLAWVMIVTILAVTERAKPQFESFFDRFYQLKLRTSWDMAFVDYLLYLTVIGLILSVLGLLLSLIRARRKGDGNRIALLAMGCFSIAGIVGVLLFK